MDQRDDGPAAVPFSQPHCYLGFRDCRRNQIGPFRSAVPFCSEIRIKKGIWYKSGMGWSGMGFKEPARKEIRARQGRLEWGNRKKELPWHSLSNGITRFVSPGLL